MHMLHLYEIQRFIHLSAVLPGNSALVQLDQRNTQVVYFALIFCMLRSTSSILDKLYWRDQEKKENCFFLQKVGDWQFFLSFNFWTSLIQGPGLSNCYVAMVIEHVETLTLWSASECLCCHGNGYVHSLAGLDQGVSPKLINIHDMRQISCQLCYSGISPVHTMSE